MEIAHAGGGRFPIPTKNLQLIARIVMKMFGIRDNPQNLLRCSLRGVACELSAVFDQRPARALGPPRETVHSLGGDLCFAAIIVRCWASRWRLWP